MNTLLFVDVDFHSEESWGAFDIAHGLDHDFFYQSMLRKNFVPFYMSMFDFPRSDNNDYLMVHDQVHRSNAAALGIVGLPDLSTVNFADEQQAKDWMNLHALVHIAENTALALV